MPRPLRRFRGYGKARQCRQGPTSQRTGRKATRPSRRRSGPQGLKLAEDARSEGRAKNKQHQGAIISRVLSPRAVSLRTHPWWQPFIWADDCSTALAANPGLSARNTPAALASGARPLFGLAPGGVCHADPVASAPVRSYRTLSPLPVPESHRRFALCGTFPCAPEGTPAGVTRHPCFVEPGLSSHFRTRLPQAP